MRPSWCDSENGSYNTKRNFDLRLKSWPSNCYHVVFRALLEKKNRFSICTTHFKSYYDLVCYIWLQMSATSSLLWILVLIPITIQNQQPTMLLLNPVQPLQIKNISSRLRLVQNCHFTFNNLQSCFTILDSTKKKGRKNEWMNEWVNHTCGPKHTWRTHVKILFLIVFISITTTSA